jgi:pilus assembly protein FimV
MKKHTRMPGRCALALAIGLALSAPAAYGAGLGRITVQSALGQPLRAEVEVTAVSREEAASLAVKLASVAAFRQANLDYNPALAGLKVSLGQRTDSGYVVRLSSPNPVSEPYLDLLLELTSSSGRVLREYTILLDPPALRTAPEVVAPAAGRSTAAAAPSPTPAAAAAAPPPQRPAAAPAVQAGASTYEVKRGDTLGSIAERTRPPSASLDQMLIALFRGNPEAFIGENMNNLRAGSVLKVPDEQQVRGIDPAVARREIAVQSEDFARYRSRLAQGATEAAPGAVAAAGQGRVTTQVRDSSAAAPAGDRLKIAQATPGAKAGDEAVARDRQLKDLLDRVAELERTNQQLQKALELQSKAGAQVQAAAEGKPGPAAAPAMPAPAPSAAPSPAAAAPSPAAPAPAAAPPAPPAPAEAPKAEAPKAAPPAEEPGMLSGLLGSNLPLVAGLGVVLAGLVGYSLYRRRKPSGEEDFNLGAEATHGNSLFGQTGGRSVDTGAVSSFNSSFVPAATQVDASDVDPVAEADVYIAYGREEQAEDILKEALRVQPDRHPARVKLMEILARRGDRAGFARHAADLMARTGGSGEDWERAAVIGRSIDPTNSMFTASAAAMAEMIRDDTMAELNLEPTKPHQFGSETVGFRAPPATLGGEATELDRSAFAPVDRRERQASDSVVSADSRISADTLLPLDSKAATEAPTVAGAALSSRAPADLSALEFESMTTMPSTRMVEPEPEPKLSPAPDKPLDFDFGLPTAGAGRAPKLPELPDLDLNLPASAAPRTEAAAAPAKKEPAGPREVDLTGGRPVTIETATASQRPRPAPLEESLIQPTLLGGLTAAMPEGPTRLMSNTDQATVPLIDFDLSGSDVPLTTRPGAAGALTGSQMASQMATKLDLARGYIDLGVKDGARELLEEVMRDGTREQRQAAIELMKQIER